MALIYGIFFLFYFYCSLRKRHQPKRYTLITDPTAMQEPLFGPNDDEDEVEDDTLFVRK